MEIDNLSIHVMPEQYRANTHHSSEDAKKTGFLILVLGLLFMLVIMGFFYYFLIYSKPSEDSSSASSKVPAVTSNDFSNNAPEEERIIITEDSRSNEEEKNTQENKEIVPEDNQNDNVDREDMAVATTTEEGLADTEETATSTEEQVASTTPVLVKGQDTDNDNISDIEEDILGTNIDSDDSDNDGFLDYSEISGLYNPLGAGKLEENSNFSRYINENFNYSFLYPKKLSINSVGDAESLVIAFDPNSFYQIISQTISEELSLDEWYKKQFSVDSIEVKEKGDYSYIASEDGNIHYLKSDQYPNIIILNYSTLEKEKIYNVISKLIFDSFEFI